MNGERGSAVVELTILTPIVILLLMFVVAGGRILQASNDVRGAAGAAARAASLRDLDGAATLDAKATAREALAARGRSCREFRVTADVSRLHPGGEVSVTVACRVDLSDLGFLGVPGSRIVSARASEVVDRYRSAP